MLRIRKITDDRTPANRSVVAEVQAIVRAQFPGMPAGEIDDLPEKLRNPLKYEMLSELFVAEDARDRVRAFALLMYAPDLGFCFLDTISAAPGRPGAGLGGALYERAREEAAALGALGLFFECLPDEPELSPDPYLRKQNAARLKFYERFGARPVMGTRFETPLEPGGTDAPFLVFDGLGRHALPDAATLRAVVRAILERKYGAVCSPAYIGMVVRSIDDASLHLRAPRYSRKAPAAEVRPQRRLEDRIALFVNQSHQIHHVRERGYVEAPVRIRSILGELEKSGLFAPIPAKRFSDRFIREVHDGALINYLERACRSVPPEKSIYPYVFPIRNAARPPREATVRAGYYCIDTFTPLNESAFLAARRAVDCALAAAERVLEGARVAYALVRPPGHHAERRAFGGFCYFNNAAIAANYLSRYGRVALLDIDYHHGNGSQDIFYERADVLTVSIHGHPRFAYPYFSGFRDETGRGRGSGYNLNIPLPETITAAQHREAVCTALKRIERHDPDYLVLAIGFDTARGDPTGTWPNRAEDFERLGGLIGAAGWPAVVVQEGGYRVRTLGTNARRFFVGLSAGLARAAADGGRPRRVRKERMAPEPIWRDQVRSEDVEAVRALVAGTGMFSDAETAIAAELVQERIEKGAASGYEFVFAEEDGRLAGYACFGPIPGTLGRFDLYWIAVCAERQGNGIGGWVLEKAEAAMREMGAERIYIDTSTSARYAPTRTFYLAQGYRKAAELPGFYRDDDGKMILVKTFAA